MDAAEQVSKVFKDLEQLIKQLQHENGLLQAEVEQLKTTLASQQAANAVLISERDSAKTLLSSLERQRLPALLGKHRLEIKAQRYQQQIRRLVTSLRDRTRTAIVQSFALHGIATRYPDKAAGINQVQTRAALIVPSELVDNEMLFMVTAAGINHGELLATASIDDNGCFDDRLLRERFVPLTLGIDTIEETNEEHSD